MDSGLFVYCSHVKYENTVTISLLNFLSASLSLSRHLATDISVQKHLKTKLVDDVLVITIDSPNQKVNSLGSEVTKEFEAILKEFETNGAAKSAVVISAKPGCFIAGADISMLEKCKTVEEARKISHEGQILFNRMENGTKPIVAAINGVW